MQALPDFEIWLDTHISSIIAKWLKEDFGYICKSAYALQLHGLDDIDIYNKARRSGFVILITKDADFPPLIERLGTPPKVILLVGDNMKRRKLYACLKPNIEKLIRLLTKFDNHTLELFLTP